MSSRLPKPDVDDSSTALDALQAAEAQVRQAPTDVGGGVLIAKVSEADGNDIGVRQAPAGS